jgi:hypothetical protein
MPAFDKFAYSDGRCFGLRQSDLRARGLTLPDPPATLIQSEIETLADFLFATIAMRFAPNIIALYADSVSNVAGPILS